MNLTDQQVEDYRTIYKKRFGKEISKKDAYEQGVKLLQLMSAVFQPITKNEYEKVNNYKDLKDGNTRNF